MDKIRCTSVRVNTLVQERKERSQYDKSIQQRNKNKLTQAKHDDRKTCLYTKLLNQNERGKRGRKKGGKERKGSMVLPLGTRAVLIKEKAEVCYTNPSSSGTCSVVTPCPSHT